LQACETLPNVLVKGRGLELSLIGAIHDATGKVPYALFKEQEDSKSYFLLLREIILKEGIPLALYHDRHSIFEVTADKSPSLEEQMEGKRPLNRFGRLMEELGITSILAAYFAEIGSLFGMKTAGCSGKPATPC
jgi:hypothetical protein